MLSFQALTERDVQKEIAARAKRDDNIVIVNDKIIACYITIVVLIILVLIIVIIVLSMLDSHKYKIF